jgi:hypothetical protein
MASEIEMTSDKMKAEQRLQPIRRQIPRETWIGNTKRRSSMKRWTRTRILGSSL